MEGPPEWKAPGSVLQVLPEIKRKPKPSFRVCCPFSRSYGCGDLPRWAWQNSTAAPRSPETVSVSHLVRGVP
jgi:hypothetical protein